MTPIPKVSAEKYRKKDRAAKVRFRIKGSAGPGVLYQGQQIITPCKGCGNKTPL